VPELGWIIEMVAYDVSVNDVFFGGADFDRPPPLGDTDAGVVIELEPFRETGHVLLMEAHAAAGNTAQALAAYERLRAKLADEFGASPSPETESAFLEILRANE
jgi:Bacterial transcriptional activator domain